MHDASWPHNPKGKHGAHQYTLADFGLNESAVRDRFASYTERFAVEVERMTRARLRSRSSGAARSRTGTSHAIKAAVLAHRR